MDQEGLELPFFEQIFGNMSANTFWWKLPFKCKKGIGWPGGAAINFARTIFLNEKNSFLWSKICGVQGQSHICSNQNFDPRRIFIRKICLFDPEWGMGVWAEIPFASIIFLAQVQCFLLGKTLLFLVNFSSPGGRLLEWIASLPQYAILVFCKKVRF